MNVLLSFKYGVPAWLAFSALTLGVSGIELARGPLVGGANIVSTALLLATLAWALAGASVGWAPRTLGGQR